MAGELAAGKPAPLDASRGCCQCKGAWARTRYDCLAGLKGLAMGPWGDGCLLWESMGGFGVLESPKSSGKGAANLPAQKSKSNAYNQVSSLHKDLHRTCISATICWGVATS